MSKTYLIETRQTFIIGYAVVMDDDMDPKEVAKQIIANEGHGGELPKELYQYDAGEVFEQCIPLNDGQIPKVFRSKNDYLSQLSDEEIVERFTMDYTKKEKEEE